MEHMGDKENSKNHTVKLIKKHRDVEIVPHIRKIFYEIWGFHILHKKDIIRKEIHTEFFKSKSICCCMNF